MINDKDEGFLLKLFNNISDGIFYVDKKFKIRFINKYFLDLSGYEESEVIGKNYHDFFSCINYSKINVCNGKCLFEKSVARKSSFVLETFLSHKYNSQVPVCIRTSPLLDNFGQYDGAISIIFENHSMYNIIQKFNDLKNIAYSDALTGLANRRYAEASLSSYLSKMRREGDMFGLLLIDIDCFKIINDTYGHEAGDFVLVSLSKILQKNFREHDLFARLGGDEFLVILENVNIKALIEISEKLRSTVSLEKVYINNIFVNFTVSIGATISNREDTMATILRRADIHLYESKNNGRNKLTHDLSKKNY